MLSIVANVGKAAEFSPENGFKWEKDRARALGVWLLANPKINYSKKLTKVRQSKLLGTTSSKLTW